MNVARMRLGALIAGLLVMGCKLTEAGPIVVRILAIDVSPPRLALLPSQSANLALNVITSRDDGGASAGSLQWSTTGGVITNNFFVGSVRHITYQAPAQPGNYLLIVKTVTGDPADTASIAVSTTPMPVHSVMVTPASRTLVVGDTTTLQATLKDSTGAVVVGRLIEWSTNDAGVATVLATGAVRAIAPGTATITALCEGKSASATVTVNPAP